MSTEDPNTDDPKLGIYTFLVRQNTSCDASFVPRLALSPKTRAAQYPLAKMSSRDSDYGRPHIVVRLGSVC